VDKNVFFKKMMDSLREDIRLTEKMKGESQETANLHVGCMESRYDTFKEEAQYEVDRYQGQINNLSNDLNVLGGFINAYNSRNPDNSVARLGNAIVLESPDQKKHQYFLAPVCGGMTIETEQGDFLVVTHKSPIGMAVIGKMVNQKVTVKAQKSCDYILREII